MTNWKNISTDKLCEALLTLKTKEECYNFLDDICTIKEVLDIAQRLEVASLLEQKASYLEISAKTGASSATICRVNKCLEYGSGGYKAVLDRMGDKAND